MKMTLAKQLKEKYSDVVSKVAKPLHFFALALLIVEALIIILSSRASEQLMSNLLIAGAGMFVFVVTVVVIILFKRPWVLLAEKASELLAFTQKVISKTTEVVNESLPNVEDVQNKFTLAIDTNPKDIPEFTTINEEEKEKIEKMLIELDELEALERQINPNVTINIENLLKQANFYFSASNPEKALEIIEHILEQEPKNSQALSLASWIWFSRGLQNSKKGEPKKAILCYEKSLDFDPEFLPALYNIACNYSKLSKNDSGKMLQDNRDKAIKFLADAINIKPEKYKQLAATDVDFTNMKNDPEFIELIKI